MMPDTIVQADLQSAVAFHQSGELKKAERIYLRILDAVSYTHLRAHET